jgi:PAS domain-containing protein
VKPRGRHAAPHRPTEPDAVRRVRPTPEPRRPAEERLFAAALEHHPLPTVIVDKDLRVVSANGIARQLLGAHEGVPLGDALGCVDARPPSACGSGGRCATCAFRRTAQRAINGETVRDRGFVMKSDHPEDDLHLIARAGPFDLEGSGRLAILALDDVNDMLRDPGIVRVCEGCGRVKDEEGWHPLHRFMADRLGIETAGPICDECAAGDRHRPR